MKWSDWYRKKDNDEIDRWIKMWFIGTHSHTTQEYVPPAPIILLSLALV